MRKIIFLIGILISIQSYAGGGTVGNGGTGVVCYSNDRQITSAVVLDLWEGQTLDHRQPESRSDDYISLAKQKLSQFSDLWNLSAEPLVADFLPRMEFLPTGTKLLLTGDVNPILAPPNGCEYAQIINYTNEDRILVNSDIWNKLDNVNQAALLTHEVLYAYLRKHSAENNSVRTRNAVAYLFSGNKLQRPNEFIPKPYLECSGEDKSQAVTSFIFFEANGKLQVEFNSILGKLMMDRALVNSINKESSSVGSLAELTTKSHYRIQGRITSFLEPGYSFVFERSMELYRANFIYRQGPWTDSLSLKCNFQSK